MDRGAWWATVHGVARVRYDSVTKQQLINNVLVDSGEYQKGSAIHIHVSNLLQTPLSSKLPHNIAHSSLCYIVGPCWLSILNIAVCTCQSQTPYLSLPLIFSPTPHKP